jgi:hypothetical protein
MAPVTQILFAQKLTADRRVRYLIEERSFTSNAVRVLSETKRTWASSTVHQTPQTSCKHFITDITKVSMFCWAIHQPIVEKSAQ